MIVFDGSYFSYALKQLIADHINTTKMYIDHIEGDFSKYVEKIMKNGEWGRIVELFAFSNMIDVELSFGVMSKILLFFIQLKSL